MDRFKFRVWDKINKEWFKHLIPLLDIENGFLADFFNKQEAFNRRYLLEQCTGTKDKNGKLVYEGDIIKTPNGSIGYIVWSQQNLGFSTKDLNPKEKEVYLFECEVIGNIHENADLLGEE